MKKIHTRTKRKYSLTSSKTGKFVGIKGKTGQKTFSTEERADSHAKDNGMKDYTIAPAKKNKRFKIVQ